MFLTLKVSAKGLLGTGETWESLAKARGGWKEASFSGMGAAPGVGARGGEHWLYHQVGRQPSRTQTQALGGATLGRMCVSLG